MNESDFRRLLGTAPPADERPARPSAGLLKATANALRRRWFLRRIGGGLGLASLAVGAFVLGWFAKPNPSPVVIVEWRTPEPDVPPSAEVPSLSADQLEMRAELSDDPTEVSRLYREAGDLHLGTNREPGEAARCYRLSLQTGGKAALVLRDTDTWLLMELKTAELHKETRHASTIPR